jgi:mono/diheme cytochrome c family protein
LRSRVKSFVLALPVLCAVGCRQQMADNQPRYKYLDASSFFSDGRSARPLEYGTIARGSLKPPPANVNPDGRQFTDQLPMPVNAALLHRGEQRYQIYCSPCHGMAGYGDGMIVRRGFLAPPSLHNSRSRALPAGYIFAVISNGYGAMPDYSYQVAEQDRWAIIAWIRTLQFSQTRSVSELTPEERAQMEEERK